MTQRDVTQMRVDLNVAYHDYNKMLNAHAFLKVQSHELGEDLVQKTFVKMWLYLVKQGKVHQMRAFLFHILKNLIIDEYRKPKALSLEALREKGYEPSVNDTKRLIDTIDGRSAFFLIQTLPLKYQVLMDMRYGKDLSIKEIAAAKQERANTVTVKLQRGLQKLRLLYRK
jgi:RNA polymerase sigma-70 factor (ECF subfamily)